MEEYNITLTKEELITLQELIYLGFENFQDMDNLINNHSIEEKLRCIYEEANNE